MVLINLNSPTITIDASFVINFYQYYAVATSFNMPNIPMQGENITGWYLVSVNEPSANAIPSVGSLINISGQTITNIFRDLHGLQNIPHFMSFASIDHTNISKIFKPNFPLPNNGTIDQSRWTTVLDSSGHHFTTSLIPHLNSQILYGYLGYFVYLMFISFNWTNLIWQLVFYAIDVSGVVTTETQFGSSKLTSSVDVRDATLFNFDLTYGSTHFIRQQTSTTRDILNINSNFLAKKLSTVVTKTTNTFVLPLDQYFAGFNLQISNQDAINALINQQFEVSSILPAREVNNMLNQEFHGALNTQPAIVFQSGSSQLTTIRHIIPQIPNSSIQFEIIGFCGLAKTIAGNWPVIGFKGYGGQYQSNFQNFIRNTTITETVNILVLDENNNLLTHNNNDNASSLSFSVSSNQTSLNLNTNLIAEDSFGTLINSSQLTDVFIFITPVIWLNGGIENQMNGGASIHPQMIVLENSGTLKINANIRGPTVSASTGSSQNLTYTAEFQEQVLARRAGTISNYDDGLAYSRQVMEDFAYGDPIPGIIRHINIPGSIGNLSVGHHYLNING